MSETNKYLAMTQPFCIGNGLDIGSQGWPVVPWAIQVELPPEAYGVYTSGKVLEQGGAWRGDGRSLPFRDRTCDFVYSSHLLEDFEDWAPALQEWIRVLRVGGHLIILVPEDDLWNAAVNAGQPPNCSHRHCGRVGELTAAVQVIHPFRVIRDSLTALTPEDYSILYIGQKLAIG